MEESEKSEIKSHNSGLSKIEEEQSESWSSVENSEDDSNDLKS